MNDALEIAVSGPVRGCIRPPGSKSLTNRALVCAALAEGASRLTGALDSEDTRVMHECLEQLGIDVQASDDGATLDVIGCAGTIPAPAADLNVRNSGTTARFLAAAVTLARGRFRLDGTPRMRERPMQDLLDGLSQLGVAARSEGTAGCPPLVIDAAGLPGGTAEVRGDVSSQFVSGLLMAAPYSLHPTTLQISGSIVSEPYVAMTCGVMRSFGVEVSVEGFVYRVPQKHYQGRPYAIEPDASAASYFLAAAAISGGSITIEGLGSESVQGDIAFGDVLRQMGCEVQVGASETRIQGRPLRGIEIDMNSISDTVPTLAAVALFASGPTTIRNIAHMRHKETDRLRALAVELAQLGTHVDELADGLRIVPGSSLHGARLATYDDHRLAMSFALVGLRVPGVVVLDPACVGKTYPGFFDDLRTVVQPLPT